MIIIVTMLVDVTGLENCIYVIHICNMYMYIRMHKHDNVTLSQLSLFFSKSSYSTPIFPRAGYRSISPWLLRRLAAEAGDMNPGGQTCIKRRNSINICQYVVSNMRSLNCEEMGKMTSPHPNCCILKLCSVFIWYSLSPICIIRVTGQHLP